MKCVIVVRTDLKMTKGKVISQSGHAIVQMMEMGNKKKIKEWIDEGEAIITVKAKNEKTFDFICQQAKKYNVFYYVVEDAGCTQVTYGSRTVCLLGPDTSEKMNKISGQLKLY